MFQDGPGLVLLDTLRHHVDDVVHHAGPLRSLGLDSKLPPHRQWGHTTQPHPPLRSLETASSNIPNRASVKTGVETQGGLAIMGRRS